LRREPAEAQSFTTAIRQKIYQMNEVERDQLYEAMMKENSEKINFINSIDKVDSRRSMNSKFAHHRLDPG
jgi:hypothetical protein